MARLYTPFNGAGGEDVTTEGDRLAEARRQAAMQAQIALAQLQATRDVANIQSRDNRYNTDAMVKTSGTFDQKSGSAFGLEALRGDNTLANTREVGSGNLAIAKEGNAPAMAGIQMAQDRAKIENPILQAKGDVELQRLAMQKSLMAGMAGGGAGRPPMTNGIMDHAPGASPVNGTAAPGPQPGGLSQDAMAAYAFGAAPGDVLKNQADERHWEQGRTAEADRLKYETAITLLKSPKPEAQATGAKLLSELKTFQGMDATSLQGALSDEVSPASAFAAHPSMSQAVDRLVFDAKQNANGFTPGGEGAQALLARVTELVQQARKLGVKEDEARAFIMDRLEKEVPTAGFWSNPILTTARAASFGTIPDVSGRAAGRSALGLTPSGMR